MKKHSPAISITRALEMRRNPTDAERQMWRLLREFAADGRFRRQVPIRHYIADFASHRARVVIEIDGGQHMPERDEARTKVLEGEGYRVLRFWNNEVLENGEECMIRPRALLGQITPIQLRLVSQLTSLRILPPSRGKKSVAQRHDH